MSTLIKIWNFPDILHDCHAIIGIDLFNVVVLDSMLILFVFYSILLLSTIFRTEDSSN